MSAFIEDEERRVIPRWRGSRTTIALGELSPVPSDNRIVSSSEDFLREKIEDWRAHRTLAFAVDLVSSAVVLGRDKEASEAARFVLAHAASVPAPARRLARIIEGLEQDAAEATDSSGGMVTGVDESRAAVRLLKQSLRDMPRNPLAWVDLARYYTILGCSDQASEAMRLAIGLAPNNRFTLRSAARLHVHLGDPERGLAILNRTSATRHDPWLLAAEIAVSAVAGKTSRQVKGARGLLKSASFLPTQTTELASALATMELMAGDAKEARRLFRQALVAPTDNSVAQAEWASRRLHAFDFEQRHLEVPRSYEARAWQRFVSGDWKAALADGVAWLDDEPFSSRPAVFGSFVAGVELDDFEMSERLARRGLQSEPGNQTLLNNLAFALASKGRISEAVEAYEQMTPSSLDDATKIAWLATGGLIEFRSGRPDRGRELYEEAIELAAQSANPFGRALAAAFLAREELTARTPDALRALARAGQLARETEELPVKSVVSKLEVLAAKRA